MYDVGELSMMMVSFKSRPTCDRSCRVTVSHKLLQSLNHEELYLYVVSLVVVTTLAEESMVHDSVNV